MREQREVQGSSLRPRGRLAKLRCVGWGYGGGAGVARGVAGDTAPPVRRSLREVSPQRRIALVSVAAALVLIAIKLAAGLASGSLGLLSEAAHSGTDLVAALLTFFAVGVAGRPADRGHPYGHGKAEHLSALGED